MWKTPNVFDLGVSSPKGTLLTYIKNIDYKTKKIIVLIKAHDAQHRVKQISLLIINKVCSHIIGWEPTVEIYNVIFS